MKELFQRWLNEESATPAEADGQWRAIQRRLSGSPRRWLWMVPVVGLAALAVALLRPGPLPARKGVMSLYVGRSDRPASEALEITLEVAP